MRHIVHQALLFCLSVLTPCWRSCDTLLQGRLTTHAEEAVELYVTSAQLKDAEARCVTRASAAAAAAEERATVAASATIRSSAEQSQSRLDSLRDCMHAELSALKAQVRRQAGVLYIHVQHFHVWCSAAVSDRERRLPPLQHLQCTWTESSCGLDRVLIILQLLVRCFGGHGWVGVQVVEKPAGESLEAEISALRSSHTDLSSTVKAIASRKADRDAVDTRLEGFRKAVEDMKASVLAHIADRAAARSADVKAALEAVQGVERRAEALEGSAADSRAATLRAGAVARDAYDGLEEVRPAVEALQQALWGARGARGVGGGGGKALIETVEEVQAAQRLACHADALAVVKDLAVQVRHLAVVHH